MMYKNSSNTTNKPVDAPADREPPPPRGSGEHHVNEMEANNVLFCNVKSAPSNGQRAPAAITPATRPAMAA